MARFFFTLLLLLGCLASLFGIWFDSGKGQLTELFSTPPLSVGAELAAELPTQKVQSLTLTSEKERLEILKEGTEWWIQTPRRARADYRRVESLLALCAQLVVKEALPTPPPEGSQRTLTINYQNGTRRNLLLGRPLPLFHGPEARIQTFEAAPPESPHWYCVYSPEHSSLPPLSFGALQDRRPFFFHPDVLRSVNYEDGKRTLLLERADTSAPWRLLRPLPLRTDPAAVAALIRSLYQLEGQRIEVGSTSPTPQISASGRLRLSFFNAANETQSLLLTGPRSALQNSEDEGTTTYFFKSEALAKVRPTVAELRSKTLSALDVAAIDFLLLQSKYQNSPLTLAIRRTASGQPRWMYQSGETGWQLASEPAVARLLEALTQDPVESFTTESLDPKVEADKSLTVYAKSGQRISFRLRTEEGRTLIQRDGEPHAAVIPSLTAAKIKTRAHEWKDPALWNLSPIELKGIMRQTKGKPTELYHYDYTFEEWRAQVGEELLTELIDPVAANQFLNALESLSVERWLQRSDPLLRTLPEPIFTFTAQSLRRGADGNSKGLETAVLRLYPLAQSRLFYLASLTRMEGREPEFCLLSRETALLLSQSILYSE